MKPTDENGKTRWASLKATFKRIFPAFSWDDTVAPAPDEPVKPVEIDVISILKKEYDEKKQKYQNSQSDAERFEYFRQLSETHALLDKAYSQKRIALLTQAAELLALANKK